MRMYHRVLTKAILMGAILSGAQSTATVAEAVEAGGNMLSLFDFTKVPNIDNWVESSDTVRQVGMSKAVLTLQKTQLFQRAIFFTLLNPQENGAGFAGVRTETNFNLTGCDKIELLCRAQGSNEHYKVVLRHKGLSEDADISYENFFTVSTSEPEFTTIKLDITKFLPYFRGRQIPNAEPLDKSNITMFGLQVYGGVYSPIKQKGVSSLEIKTIVATATPKDPSIVSL